MKTDKLEELFRNLDGDFDLETPELGHQKRFFNKLNSINTNPIVHAPKRKSNTLLLSIAASLLICFGLFIFLQNRTDVNDLASVSAELSQTQHFFTTAITAELNKIKAQRNPDNEILISDALKQLELLEKNYERLKVDLKESGNDQRVIYAMISNFQSRIDILENVLTSIENLRELKKSEQNKMTI
ncbi:hypothetical protein [Gelidibacter maritimus]|uniref:DUF4179 domain-containing protein n=1 Tax=Gelidibacter maritimus TaxID=2761487 RepID=A0A7W2M4H9_9FLAO|nr:hypothetical protein [Gelidibacter maritimus]MBA6152574.1 hypothetical protein [Gelidibacter maritimus]